MLKFIFIFQQTKNKKKKERERGGYKKKERKVKKKKKKNYLLCFWVQAVKEGGPQKIRIPKLSKEQTSRRKIYNSILYACNKSNCLFFSF